MIFFVKKKINTIFRLFYLKRYYDLYFGFQYFEQEKLRKFQIKKLKSIIEECVNYVTYYKPYKLNFHYKNFSIT